MDGLDVHRAGSSSAISLAARSKPTPATIAADPRYLYLANVTAITGAVRRRSTTLMAFMHRLLVATGTNPAVAIAINSHAA